MAIVGVALVACLDASAQTSSIALTGMPKEVAEVMRLQEEAWNAGDLEGFMQGYWKSDSLMFIGKDGMTHGRGQARWNGRTPRQPTEVAREDGFNLCRCRH